MKFLKKTLPSLHVFKTTSGATLKISGLKKRPEMHIACIEFYSICIKNEPGSWEFQTKLAHKFTSSLMLSISINLITLCSRPESVPLI